MHINAVKCIKAIVLMLIQHNTLISSEVTTTKVLNSVPRDKQFPVYWYKK